MKNRVKDIQKIIKDFIRKNITEKEWKKSYTVMAALAAVAVAAIAGSAFFLMSIRAQKPETAVAGMAVIESIENTAEVIMSRNTEAETETETQEETQALASVQLEAVAGESMITAGVLDASGTAVEGHSFKFYLLSGPAEDNSEAVRILSESGETADAGGLQAEQYVDEDQDGRVSMEGLEAGTYTVTVATEEGFEPAGAVQATVVKYEVIENIMEQVVEQSSETDREDPQNSRQNDKETEQTRPTAVLPPQPGSEPETHTSQTETNASQTETADDSNRETLENKSITRLKMENDEIVYTAAEKGSETIPDSQVAGCEWDDVIVEGQDNTFVLSGYVAQKESVTVSDGEAEVIKRMLVPQSAEQPDEGGDETEGQTASAQTVSAKTASSQTASEISTSEPKQQESQTAPSQPETETGASEKVYTVYELSPVIETVEAYADGWNSRDGKMYYFADGRLYTGWHWIEGINYYFNDKGELSSRVVIDVSHYNGSIDWNAVKSAGIDYAIMRVGYRGWGTAKLVLDSKFDENMRAAQAAGVKVGAYIVTQAVNTAEAVEEASFLIEKCRNYKISLPLAIDVEWAGDSDEEGRANRLSAAERTAVINAFAETVKNAGYTPMVYANKNWMTNYINAGSIVPFCKVWVAQYADIDCTTYGGRFDMWQFRSDGTVSGVSGYVDMSAWVY